ncbi:MAG TPA: hypothetical protein VMJ32_06815 [Pirellulales bacterium]|nr:hypothetical protein [Pirellulales bacterium]
MPIHGTVTTISGEKLNGSISFIPDDGSSGPAAMATLTDGKYQFDENNGPAVGPHKVIVRRTAAKNRIPTPNTNDTKIDTAKQNSAESKTEVKTEWKLTANLTANVNQYNFTLEP